MDSLLSCEVYFFCVYDVVKSHAKGGVKVHADGHVTLLLTCRKSEEHAELSPHIISELVRMALRHVYCRKDAAKNVTFSLNILNEQGQLLKRHPIYSVRETKRLKECFADIDRAVNSNDVLPLSVIPFSLREQGSFFAEKENSLMVWKLSQG